MIPLDDDYEDSNEDYKDVPSLIGSVDSVNNNHDAEFPLLQPQFNIVTDNSSFFIGCELATTTVFPIILCVMAIRMRKLITS